MTAYVVADAGDASSQDGSEDYPFVNVDGMRAVQGVASPGDTVLVREALSLRLERLPEPDPEEEMIEVPRTEYIALLNEISALVERMGGRL
jgi:hypothetical protein